MSDDYVVGWAYGEMAPNQSSIYETLLEKAERERDEAREAFRELAEQLTAQKTLISDQEEQIAWLERQLEEKRRRRNSCTK